MDAGTSSAESLEVRANAEKFHDIQESPKCDVIEMEVLQSREFTYNVYRSLKFVPSEIDTQHKFWSTSLVV